MLSSYMKTGKIYFANIRIGFHSDINILTVKKTLYIYIYSIFEKNAGELYLSRSTVTFCICLIISYMKDLGDLF